MIETPSSTQTAASIGAKHLSLAELEAGFAALRPCPADTGRVALIVCREAPGVHKALERVRLSIEEGVPGDEWNRQTPRNSEAQLTVIRREVAEIIANGQPLTESGDNLVVDFDLSAANLPVGTRLRVGQAIVEASPKPHNGCHKFQRRFGADAVRFVQAPLTRNQNLRGVYWRVVESGEAAVGDLIQVLSRPTPKISF